MWVEELPLRGGLTQQPSAVVAEEMATVFARMAGLMLSEETAETALALVTSPAVETVAGAVGAGSTLVDPQGRRRTAGASDALGLRSALSVPLVAGAGR